MADQPTPHTTLHTTRRPPPKALLWLLIGIVVGLNILGFVVGSLWPKLVKDHPLLLICLSGRYRFLLATARDIDPLRQIVIGVLRNLASDPVYYALGYFYGDAVLAFFRSSLGKGDVIIDATERWFHKLEAVVVFLTPSPFVCALAGMTRMRPLKFWLVNLTGTITMVSAVRAFSGVIEGPLDSFLDFNSRYNKWLIAMSVAVVVFMMANVGFGGAKAQAIRRMDDQARENTTGGGADQ